MKKLLILLAVLFVFLCGCSSQNNIDEENTITIKNFSYTEDRAIYENKPGVKTSGFRNTEPCYITGTQQLMDLAKDECNIAYNSTSMAYDEQSEVYKFTFFTAEKGEEESYNGEMYVYIDKDGVTKMTVSIEAE